MMNKRDVINFLFILGFPVYGIGNYVSAAISPSIGYLLSTSVHIVIIIFYLIDLIYKKEFRIRVNVTYVLMLLFLLSSAASLFISLSKGLPETNLQITIARSLLLVIPFNSFVVVALYNAGREDKFPKITLIGLSVLLVINLMGYFGLGWVNVTHTIEGRLSFPFLDAFYSGAGLLAIINLMLLYYIRNEWKNPVRLSLLSAYFGINLVFFYMINSRLATLIFLLIAALIFFRSLRVRGLYWVSMFTLPILLSSGLLLYSILKSPAFETVMQRVDIEDVTTFHGRSYIWEDALNWLVYDQRGLLFGNGYKAHYFLDLIHDVVKRWNAEESYHLHLHSTSLEILVCQGLIVFIIYCAVFYRVYSHYKKNHKERSEVGSFFSVVIFLLFMMQVDTFGYLDGLGALIFAVLVARAAVTAEVNVPKSAKLPHRNYIRPFEKSPVYDLHRDTRS